MTRRWIHFFGCALMFGLASSAARADFLDTVNWAADGAVDGTGTGVLGGSNTVTYTTVAAGNAGIKLSQNWDASLATDGAVGTGATNLTGGVFGTTVTGSPALQTISFSAAVVNPVLLFNFTDPTSTMDFGALSLTLLDSHNAQLAGDIASFVGSLNSFDDGFAVRVNGTFGPANGISFLYATTVPFDSVAFTVGQVVPEPFSVTMLSIGGLGVLGYSRRSRKAAAVA